MSSGKRFFDLLGNPNSGGSSSKRARSPTGNPSNPALSTQSTQITGSAQTGSSRSHKAKLVGRTVLAKVKKSLDALQQSCGMFGPVVVATKTLQEVVKIIESNLPEKDNLEDTTTGLAQWATLLTSFLEENQPVRMSTHMENLTSVLRQEADHLKKQVEGSSTRLDEWERAIRELERIHQQVEEALWKLLTEASLSVWKNTDNQLKESLLNALLPAHEAVHNSSYADKIERGPCLENTRVAVLDGVRKWIYDLGEVKVYWINGMAGTGKTTIAYSVCEELERNKRLGASFFVSRASSQCQDVSRMLPTIAYQLARISYPYRSALCRVLNEEPNTGQRKLSVQFEHLIESPLRKVADKLPKGLVVVIDALDECSDPRSTEMIANMLLQHAFDLPVRFFLTSRPVPSIMDTVLSNNRGPRSVLHLHNVEEQLVRSDIKTYFSVSLARLDPTGDQIEWLTDQAGVLFIYAATLVRYVLATGLSTHSNARFEAVLAPSTMRASKKDRAIDRLYKAILEGVLQDEEREEDELNIIKQVLWTVVSVREPVTKAALGGLLQVDDNQVTAALGPLQAVIHVFGKSEIISTLHASFSEFVLNQSRSGSLSCDQGAYNQYLAIRCFAVMKDQLRFNICGLASSYEFDEDVPNIDARVEATISPALFYACRFWAEHLALATVCDANFTNVDVFLKYQLLFWMEVLNLKGWIQNGKNVLMKANSWLMANQKNATFVKDCAEFVTAFAHGPVNLSTPHIYVSHLPLGPKGNKARQVYLERSRGLVWVEGTAVEGQVIGSSFNEDVNSRPGPSNDPPVVIHNKRIISIMFSSSGDKVATGSDDGTIGVWDSCIGSMIIRLNTGKSLAPVEVVFSPDERWLFSVSRSFFPTLMVWDVQTGLPALERASSSMLDVCFSPDSTRIAFTEAHECNHNQSSITLTILNVCTEESCELIVPDGTTSVAFSLDGNYLLLSSPGGRIQMWDSYTGFPHETHSTDASLSATRQLSLSFNRRWCIREFFGSSAIIDIGLTALAPQNVGVECGYNRQGTDSPLKTSELALRDSSTHKLLAGPFGRKGENITTFSFSPDGTRIFSGSFDGRDSYYIRAWNLPEDVGNNSMGGAWEIDENGWVRNQDAQPIICVPEKWCRLFPLPPNILAIGPGGSLKVSVNNLLLGESWTGCYDPNASF